MGADRIQIDVVYHEGPAVASMGRMNQAVANVERRVKTSSDASAKSISQITVSLEKANHAMMGLSIAYGAIQGGLGIGVLKLAADMERTAVGLETMLGSATEAQKVIADLTKLTIARPFAFPELRDTNTMLVAFGFNAEQSVRAIAAVSNAASALGTNAEVQSQKLQSISLALGEMMAKGRVNAMQIYRQLGQAGIPAAKYLSEAIQREIPTFKEEEMMHLIEKGRVDAQAAIEIIIRGIENDKRFQVGGVLAEKTLSGMFSNLEDRAVFAGIALGKAFLPQAKDAVQWLSQLADRATKAAEAFAKWPKFQQNAVIGFAGVATLVTILPPVIALVKTFGTGWMSLINVLATGITLSPAITSLMAILSNPALLALLTAGTAAGVGLWQLSEQTKGLKDLDAQFTEYFTGGVQFARSQKDLDQLAQKAGKALGEETLKLKEYNQIMTLIEAKRPKIVAEDWGGQRSEFGIDTSGVKIQEAPTPKLIRENYAEIASAEEHARAKLMQVGRKTFEGLAAVYYEFVQQYRQFGDKSAFAKFALDVARAIETTREISKIMEDQRKEADDFVKFMDTRSFRLREQRARDLKSLREYADATTEMNKEIRVGVMERGVVRQEYDRDAALRAIDQENAQTLSKKLDAERRKADIEIESVKKIAAMRSAILDQQRHDEIAKAVDDVDEKMAIERQALKDRLETRRAEEYQEARELIARRRAGPEPQLPGVLDPNKLRDTERQLAVLAEKLGQIEGYKPVMQGTEVDVPELSIIQAAPAKLRAEFDALIKKLAGAVGANITDLRQFDALKKQYSDWIDWKHRLDQERLRPLTAAEEEEIGKDAMARLERHQVAQEDQLAARISAIDLKYKLETLKTMEDAENAALKRREEAYLASINLVRDQQMTVFTGFKRQADSLFDAIFSRSKKGFLDFISDIGRVAILTPVKQVVTSQIAARMTEVFTGNKVQMEAGGAMGGTPEFGQPGSAGQGVSWFRKIFGLDKAEEKSALIRRDMEAMQAQVSETTKLRAQLERYVQSLDIQSTAVDASVGAVSSNTLALDSNTTALASLTAALQSAGVYSGGGGAPSFQRASYGGGSHPGMVDLTSSGEVLSGPVGTAISWRGPVGTGSLGGGITPRVMGGSWAGGGAVMGPVSLGDLPLSAGTANAGRDLALAGLGVPGGTGGGGGIGGALAGGQQIAALGSMVPGRTGALLSQAGSLASLGIGMKGMLGKGGALAKLGGWASKLGGGHGIGGAAGGALVAGGAIALLDAMRRGGKAGLIEATAGGAAIGTAIMPGLGTAIGAGVGALAGAIRMLFPGKRKELKEQIKARYGVLIDNNGVLDSILKTVDSTFGGSISTAITSPQIRDLISQYAMSTGQRPPIAAMMRPVNLVQSGGQVSQAASYMNGVGYGYSSNLPLINYGSGYGGTFASSMPYAPGSNPIVGSTPTGAIGGPEGASGLLRVGSSLQSNNISLQLDAGATAAILNGRTVETLQRNPGLVADAVQTSWGSNYGREGAKSAITDPLAVYR